MNYIYEADYKNYTFATLFSPQPNTFTILLKIPNDPMHLIFPYIFSITLHNTTEHEALKTFQLITTEFINNLHNPQQFIQFCKQNNIPLKSILDEIKTTQQNKNSKEV